MPFAIQTKSYAGVDAIPVEAIASSAVPRSHTGDTNETTLATETIPGGLLRANSVIEILALAKANIVAENTAVALRVYFGGTLYIDKGYGLASPGIVQGEALKNIFCANSLFAQKGSSDGATLDLANEGNIVTSPADTTQDVDIVFKSVTGDATNIFTLEGYRIKLSGL